MKIHYARQREQDYLLDPWEYRTYQNDYLMFFALGFLLSLTFLYFFLGYILDASIISLYNNYTTVNKFNFVCSGLIGIYTSFKLTKVINWTIQSRESENFYYSDTDEANEIFHTQQDKSEKLSFTIGENKNSFVLISQEECEKKRFSYKKNKLVKKEDFYKPVAINEDASILSHLIIGLAGSGKSVLLDRMYDNVLMNGHKLIVHAPDSKARDILMSSGYRCSVSAPWLIDSIYIDIFSILLNEKNEKTRNSLIDLVITSIHGVVDESSSNAFFENGAVYILTATLRKLCFEYNEEVIKEETEEEFKPNLKPTLETWRNLLISYKHIYEFKNVIETYYPEASMTISEDAEKMTASIIASMTKSLTTIGLLSDCYKNNKSSFDLKAWCIDNDFKKDSQVIILCSDNVNMEVSKANIGLFINLATSFLLSNEREISFKKNKRRVYQVIDEYPLFAKNIDVVKWLEIINVGRKYGNTAIVALQTTSQMAEALNHKEKSLETFLGSFHTQYIAAPSSQEDTYLSKVVGEITYIDTEFTGSSDSNARQSIGTSKKQRKVSIDFKQLQTDLGFKTINDEKLGLNIGIRLLGTKSVCVLFFPFVEEFGKSNRDKLRSKGQIVKDKDTGNEYFYYVDKTGTKRKKKLFFNDTAINFDKKSTANDIHTRELLTLQNTREKLIKDKKLKQLEDVNKKIEVVEKLLNPESKNNFEEKVISDVAIHSLDSTGATSLVLNTLDVFDELTSTLETEQVEVNFSTNSNESKIKLRKKQKEQER
ncbi:type IV secretion system DNA-binding domain-containing protein [Methylotenera sp. 1P/1]|uniref:type IV secretion system DNA-binding domain-containing protein n=1 Tax=Methylotenera sp. 1P/1 TaxID=1131551 RepID=UPI0003614AE0|nr:type IV secretion system DNA-binding domain-containing protein [Methylotenera sp. 1P/1]